MGDVDGDGVLDLVVGAGKDHAPEVVAYAGASIGGKGAFGTELARLQPFDAAARGGVSVAVAQIDGTTSDNIIVGSAPGLPSEVKIYRSLLPLSAGAVPSLFASFKPYGEDRSGVSIATGFVDFSTGRESIVTAPGPGSPSRGQGVRLPAVEAYRQKWRGSHARSRDRPTREHRLVHSVRKRLSRRRFPRDGLARRLARGRQAHHRQSARGQGFGEGLFERLRTGRRPVTLSAESRCTTTTARTSARSPPSSHSTDRPAHGSPRPARRRAPICWSAVSRPAARTQAFSNTSSSGRMLRRRRCKPCVSDKSGPEKRRSPPCSAAISGLELPIVAGIADNRLSQMPI